MKKKLHAFLEDKVFSISEPKGLNFKKFCIINILFFITIGGIFKILTLNNYLAGKESSVYWDVWVIFLIIGMIKLAFVDLKKSGRFVLLTIYAQNRTLVCMIILAILFFPIELIFINTAENYMQEGFYHVSTAIKSIAYLYFYYIFIRLFYSTVLKNEKPNQSFS